MAHHLEAASVAAPRIVAGIARLPELSTLTFTHIVQAGETLAVIAARSWAPSANALPYLAALNADAAGLLASPQSLVLIFSYAKLPLVIAEGDTLRSILTRVQEKLPELTLGELAQVLGDQQGLLLTGAPVSCPPARLPAALSPADIAPLYHASALAFALTNAAVGGLIAPGLTLASGCEDVAPVQTQEGDSFNSVLARFASHELGLEGILVANAELALFNAGAVALLPPLELASTPITAKAALAPELARTASNAWQVNFGTAGSTAVAVRPGVTVDGVAQPRFFSLAPHYPSLVSRLVPIRALMPDASLAGTPEERQFSGVDVETWASQFLSDMDRLASLLAETDQGAVLGEASTRIQQVRARLADAIPLRLEPVFKDARLQDAQLEAGVRGARRALSQRLASSLASGYAEATIAQFDAAVDAPWTGQTPNAPLSLEGMALEYGPAPESQVAASRWQASVQPLSLQEAAPCLAVWLQAKEFWAQSSVPVSLGYSARQLAFDVSTVPAQTGYQVATVLELAARPEASVTPAPIIPRAVPGVHLNLLHEARGSSGDGEEATDLAAAAQWIYAVTCRGELAEQDVLLLAVNANVPVAPQAVPAGVSASSDIFSALAQYISVAPGIWRVLPGLVAPVTEEKQQVLRRAAVTMATLAELVAEQWNAVLPSASGALRQPDAGAQQFEASVRYRADDKGEAGLDDVTLLRIGGNRSLGFSEWPQLYCEQPDGTTLKLAMVVIDETRACYQVPGASAVLAPGLTLTFVWSGLNIAAVQGGHCALGVQRNARPLAVNGLGINPALLLASGITEPPTMAVPCICWNSARNIAGESLEAALRQALQVLFPPAQRQPQLRLALQLSYGYNVGPDESMFVEQPVALVPDLPLDDAIAPQVAEAASRWQQATSPETRGAAWIVALTLHSLVNDEPQLLLQGRLKYGITG